MFSIYFYNYSLLSFLSSINYKFLSFIIFFIKYILILLKYQCNITFFDHFKIIFIISTLIDLFNNLFFHSINTLNILRIIITIEIN